MEATVRHAERTVINTPMPGWECHAVGCEREREGYSWWCMDHRNRSDRNVLVPCPCHGVLPPGADYHSIEETRPGRDHTHSMAREVIYGYG